MNQQGQTDRWYYAKNKKRVGPVSLARLRQLLAHGVLTSVDMVFREGSQNWRPLGDVIGTKPNAARDRRKRILATGATAGLILVLLAFFTYGFVSWRNLPDSPGDIVGSAQEAENISGAEHTEKKQKAEAPETPAVRNKKPPLSGAPDAIGKGSIDEKANRAPNKLPDAVPTNLVAQLGHSVPISSVALSGDGKWLVTGSLDNTARLWEVATGREVRAFQGPSKAGSFTTAVSSVSMSSDSKLLVTGSLDNTARLWEVATGKEIRAFQGHSEGIKSVALSNNNKWLITGSFDKTARLWEVATGKEIRAFQGHSEGIMSVSMSSDGKWLITGSLDKTARLWEVATGKEVRAFAGHADVVTSVSLSGDGKWLVTGSVDNARLWDIATGKEIRAFPGSSDLANPLKSAVSCVSITSDGRLLVTGGFDGTAHLWEVATGKEVQAFQMGDAGISFSIFLSSDGKWLVTSMMTASDSSGLDNTARLWEVATGKDVRAFRGHSSVVQSVHMSGDGKWLVTGCWDKTARLWDMIAGKEIRAFRGHSHVVQSVFLSGDGNWLATGSADNTARVWAARTGKQESVFQGHTGAVNAVCLSSDNRWLVTGSADSTARLWEVATGQESRAFEGHSGAVSSVRMSSDGKWLVTGSVDCTARLWEVATGREVCAFMGHSNAVVSVSVSSDGKWLVTSSLDNTCRLWEVATGKEVRAFHGHSSIVLSVLLTADGKWLVTGSADNTARLWEVATGEEIRVFRGHSGWVTSVFLSADDKWLATGGADCTTRLWDVNSDKELCQLMTFSDGNWAVVDAAGRYDASAGGDIEGLHWVAGNETIALTQLKEQYYDPGLLGKHMGFNKEFLRPVKGFHEVKLFPEVTVTPSENPTSAKLSLNLTNRGGGIGKVQVFVNGRESLADARGSGFTANQAKARVVVDLANAPTLRPGDNNEITVVTWNEEGYLSSRGVQLDWRAPGKKEEHKHELYAIIGGISDYGGPSLRLRYAAKDAEDIAQTLTVGANRLFQADKVHVTLLATSSRPDAEPPTRANFEKAFQDVRKKARPDDLLVVYLAGHGVSLPRDGYCYLTQEARTADEAALSNPALVAQTAITSTELTEWIKEIPARKVVLILDTCAAGAAADKLTEIRQVSGDQVLAIERLKDRTGFHILMGCAGDKVSYEPPLFEQGLLTHALLKGIRSGEGLREERFLDVSKLFQYAADVVPNLARGIGKIQEPRIAARKGTSFDVALFTKEDKAMVPLKAAKPIVLRPRLENDNKVFDNLQLTLEQELRKRLANAVEVSGKEKGLGLGIEYMDTEEMAGAVRPWGRYTVIGDKVGVRLQLIRDGVPLQKEPLRIDGTLTDREALLDRLVEIIAREARLGQISDALSPTDSNVAKAKVAKDKEVAPKTPGAPPQSESTAGQQKQIKDKDLPPPITKAKVVDERLFLVFALEDLARDIQFTLIAQEKTKTLVSPAVRQFTLEQRFRVDSLRRHIESKKFESGLLDSYDGYRALLDSFDALEKSLLKREITYREPLEKMVKNHNAVVNLQQLRAQTETMNTGLDAAFRTDGGLFDRAVAGLFAGMVRAQAAELETALLKAKAGKALQAEMAAYISANQKEFVTDMARIRDEFSAKFEVQRDEWIKRVKESTAEIANKHGWNKKGWDFNPCMDLEQWRRLTRPGDIFLLRYEADQMTPPKDREARNRHLELAAACLKAAKMVPAPEAGKTALIYKYYRGLFCGIAVKLGLEAAEEEIGTTGFNGASQKPAQGAMVALTALDAFRKYGALDKVLSSLELSKGMLAHALAGKLDQAYAEAKLASLHPANMQDPHFLYCAARICSLKHDAKNGFLLLGKVYSTGSIDMETIRNQPDLEWLRSHPQFEQLLKSNMKS